MKDIAHHRQHAVRKVIQSVRREEIQADLNGKNSSFKNSSENSSPTNKSKYQKQPLPQFT